MGLKETCKHLLDAAGRCLRCGIAVGLAVSMLYVSAGELHSTERRPEYLRLRLPRAEVVLTTGKPAVLQTDHGAPPSPRV